MITLEQIRLLESKIARAIELIRVLKEENSSLHKGLESAQKRMKELETLVDGFKTDQKEIESVIVRTLHTLDEVEENVSAKRQDRAAAPGGSPSAVPATKPEPAASRPEPASRTAPVDTPPAAPGGISPPAEPVASRDTAARPAKEELDIF
jgi:FtsZ-binding cell division protein ZapB